MNKINKINYIIILFCVGYFSFAQDYVVSEIKISGLERTRERTVINIIGINPGDNLNRNELDEIEQKILKAGIFTNNIELKLLEKKGNKADLIIKIEDKWTLIPIPFFSYSSDKLLVGGLFIESNLLGMNQSLFSGGFYSEDGISFFSAYSPSQKGDYKFSYFISAIDGSEEVGDFKGNIVEENKIKGLSFGSSITKNLTNALSISLSGRYSYSNNLNYLSLDPTVKFEKIKLFDYYKRGYNINLSLENKIDFSETTIYPQLKADFNYHNLLLNNFFSASLFFAYNLNNNYPLYLKGTKGSSIFATQLESDIYITTLLNYELKIIDFSWGYITIPLYYETGFVENYNDYLYYSGPGVGILTYLNKVAIPAVGANFIYDFVNSRYNWGVSFGMNM